MFSLFRKKQRKSCSSGYLRLRQPVAMPELAWGDLDLNAQYEILQKNRTSALGRLYLENLTHNVLGLCGLFTSQESGATPSFAEICRQSHIAGAYGLQEQLFVSMVVFGEAWVLLNVSDIPIQIAPPHAWKTERFGIRQGQYVFVSGKDEISVPKSQAMHLTHFWDSLPKTVFAETQMPHRLQRMREDMAYFCAIASRIVLEGSTQAMNNPIVPEGESYANNKKLNIPDGISKGEQQGIGSIMLNFEGALKSTTLWDGASRAEILRIYNQLRLEYMQIFQGVSLAKLLGTLGDLNYSASIQDSYNANAESASMRRDFVQYYWNPIFRLLFPHAAVPDWKIQPSKKSEELKSAKSNELKLKMGVVSRQTVAEEEYGYNFKKEQARMVAESVF